MSEVTMSVHEGLAKLKLYDQKIQKMTQQVPPMVAVIKNKDIVINGKSKDTFKNEASAFLASFESLIENKSRLKSEIVRSNATTTVVINGVTYTIAEAIERKGIMNMMSNLINNLTYQMNNATNTFNSLSSRFQNDFEKFLSNLGGDASKRKPEEVEVFRKTFEETNGVMLYDPLKLTDKVNGYTDDYERFMTEVDFRLSESNALTKITVNFVD